MKIGKARKKPVEIEFLQFTGQNNFDVLRFIGRGSLLEQGLNDLLPTDCPVIPTLEGNMSTSPGDYIIKGVKGEFYPCKPDIFTLTYEILENSN